MGKVTALRHETRELKKVVAEQILELRLVKKYDSKLEMRLKCHPTLQVLFRLPVGWAQLVTQI